MVRYGLDEHEWQALEDEVLELFTALLRVDTTNGNETEAALVVQAYLAENGIASELDGELPDRQSLVARLDGARPGRTLDDDGAPRRRAGRRRRVERAAVRRRREGRLRLGRRHHRHEEPGGRRGGRPRPAQALGRRRSPAPSSTPPPRTRRTASSAACSGSASTGRTRCAPTTSSTRAWAACGCRWTASKVFLLAVGEKAFAQFRIRTRGRGGHGSVPEKERSAVIDLARAVTALGLADPPAIVSGTTARFIDVLVPDAALAARLKDPATARAAGAELRAARPGRGRSHRAAVRRHAHPHRPRGRQGRQRHPDAGGGLHRLPHPPGDDPRRRHGLRGVRPGPARHRLGVRVGGRDDAQRVAALHALQRRASSGCCAGTCPTPSSPP